MYPNFVGVTKKKKKKTLRFKFTYKNNQLIILIQKKLVYSTIPCSKIVIFILSIVIKEFQEISLNKIYRITQYYLNVIRIKL